MRMEKGSVVLKNGLKIKVYTRIYMFIYVYIDASVLLENVSSRLSSRSLRSFV